MKKFTIVFKKSLIFILLSALTINEIRFNIVFCAFCG